MSFLKIRYTFLLLLFSLYFSTSAFARADGPLPFEIEQNRLTFAQMYLGYEYELSKINVPSVSQAQSEINSFHSHKLTFGAWHFWGIADIWLTFPIKTFDRRFSNSTYRYSPGIETGLRLYPFRLKSNKLRPFIGASFRTEKFSIDSGPSRQRYVYPVQFGLSIVNNSFQLEAGLRYDRRNTFSYPVSRTQSKTIENSKFNLFVGLRHVVDTTLQQSKILKLTPQENGLYPFFGIGLTTAYTTKDNNSFFKKNANWISNDANSLLQPEFTIGLHWKNSSAFNQRTIAQISYRRFNYDLKGHGSTYKLDYQSIALEVAQSLFDYHGFVPHVGVSYNMAELKMSGDSNASTSKNILGFIVGWDTLPFGAGARWTLRSNLRWYPNVELKTQNETVSFPNFEFNFIQFVMQFGKV